MILSVEEAKNFLPELSTVSDNLLKQKLDAVEIMVRKYTNNNFQNRNIRFLADSVGTILNGSSPFLVEGDTIQVSDSRVNDGLYVLKSVSDGSVVVDKPLFTVGHNLVTKVEYPADVKLGIINLLKWDVANRDKVGIKSETISRHSVTYFDLDSSNQVMGYPVSLLGFLESYKKARF
jgi:hypothetical protein